MVVLVLAVCLGLDAAQTLADPYIVRFSDTPSSQSRPPFRLASPSTDPDAPMALAHDWLKANGWQQVWPKRILGLGKRPELFFAGPPAWRYLRIYADQTYYVWSRRLEVDPHQRPFLEITWSVDRFPQEAALDLYGRNDRPIAVVVSFGPKVPSEGLLPDVPRALAFFWGETETVGAMYVHHASARPRRGEPAVQVPAH